MAVISFLRRGGEKIVDPKKLLLKQYGLSKRQRVEMLVRGVVLSQFAVPIGSFLYFMWFQMKYVIQYPDKGGKIGTFVNFSLKDTWDRLPIHIDNALNHPFFAPLGTVNEPEWWVGARHDLRKVLIGFVATLLIGAITVGFKHRERASIKRMLISVPLAFIAASAVAGVLIFLFDRLPTVISHFGTSEHITYVSDWVGRGQTELLVIGVVAGLVAKRILARTFDTLQLMSIERNIAQGDEIKGIRKVLYGANYRNRWDLVMAEIEEGKYEPNLGNPWIGFVLFTVTPFLFVCLVGGIWLLYFGPAAGAAH